MSSRMWKHPSRVRRRRLPCRSFNGATFSRTWKSELAPTLLIFDEILQWSHSLSDVETGRGRRGQSGSNSSFNGAISSRIWKRVYDGAVPGAGFRLQWSHVLTNVETNPGARIRVPAPGRFNRATSSRI
jgi:hypothetical protein